MASESAQAIDPVELVAAELDADVYLISGYLDRAVARDLT